MTTSACRRTDDARRWAADDGRTTTTRGLVRRIDVAWLGPEFGPARRLQARQGGGIPMHLLGPRTHPVLPSPNAGGRGRDRPGLLAVVLGHGSCRLWTAWPLLRAPRFDYPQVRPDGDPPLRTRGRCAAWQAGSQLSRGGPDLRRHSNFKKHTTIT